LATLRRVNNHGGKVFACDLNPLPEPEASSVPFMKVDVTSWKEQLELFKAAQKQYGKIDQVFANAGIAPSMTLLEDDVDENGDLLPPKQNAINVNFIGCLYTVKLAIHYLRKNPNGGSIVMSASGSSFSRFPGADYSVFYSSLVVLVLIQSKQSPNTPSSASSALSTRPSTLSCLFASTPSHPPGQIHLL
jgi:NAD(P)-dependent dehydrogenase (short-subunit alcohol dehydrogenase family)